MMHGLLDSLAKIVGVANLLRERVRQEGKFALQSQGDAAQT